MVADIETAESVECRRQQAYLVVLQGDSWHLQKWSGLTDEEYREMV